MAIALLSLARGQQPDRLLAMTGELTLTGLVLPVGGIREKAIAARRVGIHELILPEANRSDVEELPDHIKEGLTIHFVERLRQVVDRVFAPEVIETLSTDITEATEATEPMKKIKGAKKRKRSEFGVAI